MQQYVQRNIKKQVRQIIALQNGVHRFARQNKQLKPNMYSILSDTRCLNLNRIKSAFIAKINITHAQMNNKHELYKQDSLTNTKHLKDELSIDHFQTPINYVQKQPSISPSSGECLTNLEQYMDFKPRVSQEQQTVISNFSNIQSQAFIVIPEIIEPRERNQFEQMPQQILQKIEVNLLAGERTPKRKAVFAKQNQQFQIKSVISSHKKRSYALNPSPHITPHTSTKKDKNIPDSTEKTSKIYSSNEKRRKFIEIVSLRPNRKNGFSNCAFTTEPY